MRVRSLNDQENDAGNTPVVVAVVINNKVLLCQAALNALVELAFVDLFVYILDRALVQNRVTVALQRSVMMSDVDRRVVMRGSNALVGLENGLV